MFLFKFEIKFFLDICLKNKIKILLVRLDKFFCNVKLIVILVVFKIVISDVVFILRILINIKVKIIYIIVFIKDFKKDISKGLLFFNDMVFLKFFIKNFVNFGYIKYIIKKVINFLVSIGK